MAAAALRAAVLTTALVLVPRASAAQKADEAAARSTTSGEQVLLVYEERAPADCPKQAEFEAEVSKLTSKAHFTKQRGARRVRIELDSRGSDVLGRLITGDGKNQSSREVRGQDCREVSSALAIAVALTIDPNALGMAEPEPEPKPELEPARPPPTKQPSPERRVVPRVPPTSGPRLDWALGMGLTLQSAWAPNVRPGAHAFAMLGVGQRFRLSAGAVRFFTREVDGLSFGGWFGQSSLSYNLALLGILRPYASLGFEAGAVSASGSGLAAGVSAERPWQAGSAGLGLRLETADFFLQLGASLSVPFSRQRYLVSDPQNQVRTSYEVPPLGLKQETSVGVFL